MKERRKQRQGRSKRKRERGRRKEEKGKRELNPLLTIKKEHPRRFLIGK
jgi:hypothetical protein